MKIRIIFAFVACLFTFQTASAQVAATQNSNALTNKWKLQCAKQAEGKPTQCFSITTLRSPQNNNIFANVAISKPLAGKLPVMQITTPLVVMLTHGITIKVGQTKANKAPYNFCMSTGCVSTVNIADDIMVALNSSKTLALQYVLLGNRTANVNLDLAGFNDIYNSMVAEQEKLNKEFAEQKAQ